MNPLVHTSTHLVDNANRVVINATEAIARSKELRRDR